MNIFLLSLMDKYIGGAMVKLSQLPARSSILTPTHKQILTRVTEEVVNTYVNFFKSVKVIPDYFEFTITKTQLTITNLEINDQRSDLEKKLFVLVDVPMVTSVLPVSVQISRSKKLLWYTGIAILEGSDQCAEFFLNEFSVNSASVRYSSESLHYLDNILEKESSSEFLQPRKLAAFYGKNYNQFQKDCRSHFGDTFHQFYNKIKMLDVVGDILFTNYSLKEIAYRNQFFNYNSMYTLFKKKYKFPIDSIPRVLAEI